MYVGTTPNTTKAHKTRVQGWEMLSKNTKDKGKKKGRKESENARLFLVFKMRTTPIVHLLALLIANNLGFMQLRL